MDMVDDADDVDGFRSNQKLGSAEDRLRRTKECHCRDWEEWAVNRVCRQPEDARAGRHDKRHCANLFSFPASSVAKVQKFYLNL